MNYIDLFSGSGGLSLGFEKAGFKNIFSADIDPNFNKTYKRNFPKHKLIEKDIALITEAEVKKLTEGIVVDIVVGGPPCQGFSMAGNIGRKFIDDPRNHLFNEFARIIKIVKPRYFLMENVARMFTHNGGKTREEVIEKFNELGYTVEAKVLNTADYGVPQQRRRVIFIGRLGAGPVYFPAPIKGKYVTIKDAIDDLPDTSSELAAKIPNHIPMKHTDQMLKKMSYLGDGGSRVDIPEELRPISGDIRKYIKYDSTKPSICITGDMRKVFHYKYNRALTVRELARIQTYPDWFVFEGSTISQQQQVGNSVPPLFAQHLAETVKRMAASVYVAA